jgi:pyruvate dehydrogenase E2 component (dihydrolipoamide acetyltransferase)
MNAIPPPPRTSIGRLKPEHVMVDGAAIGLMRLGDPAMPPVLLVHGFSGDMLTWQFNLAPLARDHHVVAIDLPGHGLSSAAPGIGPWRSMAGWLARLVEVLALDRPHLVGHSLGGRLTLGLVELDLIEARSLTLISCAGISPAHDYAFLKRLSEVATLDEAQACSRHLFGGAALDVTRFARALLTKVAVPETRRALAEFLDQNFGEDETMAVVPTDWRRVSCPLQVIWGRDDSVVPLPAPEWLPPYAPLHLLDAVGHLPHLAAADRVNGLLGGFVRGAASSRRKAERP